MIQSLPPNKMSTLRVTMIAAALALLSQRSFGNDIDTNITQAIAKISEECREHGSIMAEAKWAKLKKSPRFSSEINTNEVYAAVVAALQQQCVSVKKISLLRLLKSQMPSKQATEMRLDEMILEQLSIIEKTI